MWVGGVSMEGINVCSVCSLCAVCVVCACIHVLQILCNTESSMVLWKVR